MNSNWNKAINAILSLVSVLAGTWLVFLLLLRGSIEHGNGEDTQSIQQTDENYPITRVDIPEKTLQLGKIIRGDTIIVSFMIRNIGTETLYIDSVHPDCTCTGYDLDQSEVPAGDQTTLSLTIATTHKYGPQQINAVMDCNSEEGFHIFKVFFDVVEP